MIRHAAVSALGLAALAGCATVPPAGRLESFSVGRSAAGDACVVTRRWSDPAAPDTFARAYALTCSGSAANRVLGTLRAVADTTAARAALEAQFECGPAVATGDGLSARRCYDRVSGLDAVRIDERRGDTLFVAAAAPGFIAQAEEALAIASGRRPPNADITRTPTATVDLAALPPGPASTAAAVGSAAGDPRPLDVASALSRGVDLNHKGLHVEASRLLNDALARLGPTAPPAARAELLLEAGLADSNIKFPDAARAHFAAADAVFAQFPGARTPFLARKRDTYLALDAINRDAPAEALATLDQVTAPPTPVARPLADPDAIRLVNQPQASGVGALAVPDAGQLSQLVLDAQAKYARSVALLAAGDLAGATAAIDAAAATYRPLASERLDQAQLLWLGARIVRQRGRIQAKEGRYGAALDNLGEAITLQRRGSIANGGTGAEPAIAEAELERAAVYARTGADRGLVRDAYGSAIDALIASGSTSLGGSIGMEDYLDLLAIEAGTAPQADTYERFFRAVQASGEPAVARQLTQLREVVTADPVIGQAVRERADLERELTRLRFVSSTRQAGDPTPSGNLEQARVAAERRLLEVDATLATDPRYRVVDEAPATLAELRAALRPGEAFLKLTALNRRIYGLVVTADRTFAYRIADSANATAAVDLLARQLRASIDGDLAAGKLVPFDEARAYTLFRLLAGPAAPVLAEARAIAVDPAGPLQQLPLGVLVTRYAADAAAPAGFDYSRSAFLASSASISTALSPRSFLVARALPASTASRPFIGLGEHRPPAASGAGRPIDVGYGCQVDYGRLATLARSLRPISRRELGIAASALGVPTVAMTGAAFTDTAVEARGDLDQFQVLHFATHGLEEGVWGCSKSPPALVTSFAPGGSDGLLSFAEIAQLRLDANLVVLSACDTAAGVRDQALARASGQEEAGSTLEGLVRAFLTANARAVMATYWQVSAEKEADTFVRTFYGAARTGTIGDALRDAQRAMIAQPAYSHPFYWGAYFLVGDSAKSALSQPAPPRVAAR